jgi:hypothetical protein
MILLVGLLSSLAIAQIKPDSQPVITIKRETSLGCSPDYSAEIYRDGTVVYHGVTCVKVVGDKRHKISADAVDQLIKAFDRANYFSFKDAYEFDEHGISYTDLARTTTSISIDGKHKQVVDYLSPPKKLVALEGAIEKLAALYQYIGPL